MEFELFKEILKYRETINKLALKHWLKNTLFSYQWWLLIVVLILPWILLWKLLDKSNRYQILLYGFITMVLVILLDSLGINLMLWAYSYQILPFSRQLLHPINLSFLPVSYMLIYQYFRGWQSFFITHTILALFNSFLFEPWLVEINIYERLSWKYIYSFPIYILMGVSIKLIVDRLKPLN
ncbi:hypothetical protein U472_06165 [Orenia metallireducens]|jgi:hypothetical protein|uniref:Uncharacterized protein n=1 Tax=Orenia metallireducens TaxID=1413210 RepID=A0A1C0A9U5_9FIRM|nr:CBO0543 family protein [Orenia metallireducens]OCL27064.1 hypothetical protein U472_06165 [Orenia metallireducens]